MTSPRIVFLGTPEFARVIVDTLSDSGYAPVAVFAQPDRPAGRGKKLTSPPVALWAREKNIPLFQPESFRKDPQALIDLQNLEPDLLVVAAFGQILPTSVLQAARVDSVNVHASLLPRWRGAAPINFSLLEDDPTTGVSLMRVVKELDAGPVFARAELKITNEDNSAILTEKLAKLGAELLVQHILAIAEKKISPIEQDQKLVTHAPKLSRALSAIDWTQPARKIFSKIRALVPWPLAETKLQGQRLLIHAAQVLSDQLSAKPGEIVHLSSVGWTVATGHGALLVTHAQLEGKRVLPVAEIANGLRLQVGEILGS